MTLEENTAEVQARMIAAKEIADEAVERAHKRGATHVVVIVGFDDGVHHTGWRGVGTIRGGE